MLFYILNTENTKYRITIYFSEIIFKYNGVTGINYKNNRIVQFQKELKNTLKSRFDRKCNKLSLTKTLENKNQNMGPRWTQTSNSTLHFLPPLRYTIATKVCSPLHFPQYFG